MSVDLAVWEGPAPASDDEAAAVFEDLSKRFLDSPATPPSKEIAEYVNVLLARYPDLNGRDGDEDGDEVPWGSGPLIRNASGPILYIDMKLNTAFEQGWRYCVETATSRGLIAFDPQSGTLANSDPTLTRDDWVPTDERRRGGPIYRWFSLRSWRWPFLRPLLPLLRRFDL